MPAPIPVTYNVGLWPTTLDAFDARTIVAINPAYLTSGGSLRSLFLSGDRRAIASVWSWRLEERNSWNW